jgi:hypothetical protein
VRCESAVRAVTSKIDLFACCMSEPIRYEVPYRHVPIHGLGGCDIPETVTHPSTNRGERCHAAREGSGVDDYLAALEQHHSTNISEERLDSNPQPLDHESVTPTTRPQNVIPQTYEAAHTVVDSFLSDLTFAKFVHKSQ